MFDGSNKYAEVATMKRVTFTNPDKVFLVKRYETAPVDHRQKQQQQAYLASLEKYMRSVDLLLPNEYLELVRTPTRHIRGDLINFICHERNYLASQYHVKILVS
jgi:hypothetical protein